MIIWLEVGSRWGDEKACFGTTADADLLSNSHTGKPLASQQLLIDHMSRIPCSFNGCMCGSA